MPFQTTVNTNPAPGLEGSFASANPYSSMVAGDTALVAGSAGVIVGRMAWARNDNSVVTNGHPGVPSRLGFVSKYNIVLITVYLAQASQVIQPGVDMTLHDAGDWWARLPAGGSISQKIYASYADGSLTAAATGAATTNALITANTTNASNVLTVTANTGAAIALGQPVSGTNIPAGAVIGSFGTGTGGAGTYNLVNGTTGANANATGTATGTTVTATTNFETRWLVHSTAAATELAKISTKGLN